MIELSVGNYLQEHGGWFCLVWPGGDHVDELGKCETNCRRKGKKSLLLTRSFGKFTMFTFLCNTRMILMLYPEYAHVISGWYLWYIWGYWCVIPGWYSGNDLTMCVGWMQKCNFRTAAYLIAIERIAACYRVSGIFPWSWSWNANSWCQCRQSLSFLVDTAFYLPSEFCSRHSFINFCQYPAWPAVPGLPRDRILVFEGYPDSTTLVWLNWCGLTAKVHGAHDFHILCN
jgi:hypothetical protein